MAYPHTTHVPTDPHSYYSIHVYSLFRIDVIFRRGVASSLHFDRERCETGLCKRCETGFCNKLRETGRQPIDLTWGTSAVALVGGSVTRDSQEKKKPPSDRHCNMEHFGHRALATVIELSRM